jgi:hypothetical protein
MNNANTNTLTGVLYGYEHLVRELNDWVHTHLATSFAGRADAEIRRTGTGATTFRFHGPLTDGRLLKGTGAVYLDERAQVRCDVALEVEGESLPMEPLPASLVDAGSLAREVLSIVDDNIDNLSRYQQRYPVLALRELIAAVEKWQQSEWIDKATVRHRAREVDRFYKQGGEIQAVIRGLYGKDDARVKVIEKLAMTCRKVVREVKGD